MLLWLYSNPAFVSLQFLVGLATAATNGIPTFGGFDVISRGCGYQLVTKAVQLHQRFGELLLVVRQNVFLVRRVLMSNLEKRHKNSCSLYRVFQNKVNNLKSLELLLYHRIIVLYHRMYQLNVGVNPN